MTSDERNFRSIYYEKVGCKSVEEKKSLENLLKEKNPDLTKLKQFSLRFAVPHVYRSLLWKLLLGKLNLVLYILISTVLSHTRCDPYAS